MRAESPDTRRTLPPKARLRRIRTRTLARGHVGVAPGYRAASSTRAERSTAPGRLSAVGDDQGPYGSRQPFDGPGRIRWIEGLLK